MSEPPRDLAFISSHKNDQLWRERLEVHLEPLLRQNVLTYWSETRIQAGDDWKAECEQALSRACVILLLVSADYLISLEMEQMRAAARVHRVALLWFPVRSSAYEVTELADIAPLWDAARPLALLSREEAELALVQIGQRITAAMLTARRRRDLGQDTRVQPPLFSDVDSLGSPKRLGSPRGTTPAKIATIGIAGASIFGIVFWLLSESWLHTFRKPTVVSASLDLPSSSDLLSAPLDLQVVAPREVLETEKMRLMLKADRDSYIFVYSVNSQGRGLVIYMPKLSDPPTLQAHQPLPLPPAQQQGWSVVLTEPGIESKEYFLVYAFTRREDFLHYRPQYGSQTDDPAALSRLLTGVPKDRWALARFDYVIKPSSPRG